MSEKGKQANSEEQSRRILERVAQESETVGTSSFKRVADRVKDHMEASDAPDDDPIEVWGTRIGRGLGLIFFVFLVFYLTITYIL